MTLTQQQIRDLLDGAGPSLTTEQVEVLQAALRDGGSVTAEGLGLLSVPAIRGE
jgi:hypothetical protein